MAISMPAGSSRPVVASAFHPSLAPVGVLLALERRAAQLAQLAARLGPRGDIRALLEATPIDARAELVVQLMQFFGHYDSDDGRATLQ